MIEKIELIHNKLNNPSKLPILTSLLPYCKTTLTSFILPTNYNILKQMNTDKCSSTNDSIPIFLTKNIQLFLKSLIPVSYHFSNINKRPYLLEEY